MTNREKSRGGMTNTTILSAGKTNAKMIHAIFTGATVRFKQRTVPLDSHIEDRSKRFVDGFYI